MKIKIPIELDVYVDDGAARQASEDNPEWQPLLRDQILRGLRLDVDSLSQKATSLARTAMALGLIE